MWRGASVDYFYTAGEHTCMRDTRKTPVPFDTIGPCPHSDVRTSVVSVCLDHVLESLQCRNQPRGSQSFSRSPMGPPRRSCQDPAPNNVNLVNITVLCTTNITAQTLHGQFLFRLIAPTSHAVRDVRDQLNTCTGLIGSQSLSQPSRMKFDKYIDGRRQKMISIDLQQAFTEIQLCGTDNANR